MVEILKYFVCVVIFCVVVLCDFFMFWLFEEDGYIRLMIEIEFDFISFVFCVNGGLFGKIV